MAKTSANHLGQNPGIKEFSRDKVPWKINRITSNSTEHSYKKKHMSERQQKQLLAKVDLKKRSDTAIKIKYKYVIFYGA